MVSHSTSPSDDTRAGPAGPDAAAAARSPRMPPASNGEPLRRRRARRCRCASRSSKSKTVACMAAHARRSPLPAPARTAAVCVADAESTRVPEVDRGVDVAAQPLEARSASISTTPPRGGRPRLQAERRAATARPGSGQHGRADAVGVGDEPARRPDRRRERAGESLRRTAGRSDETAASGRAGTMRAYPCRRVDECGVEAGVGRVGDDSAMPSSANVVGDLVVASRPRRGRRIGDAGDGGDSVEGERECEMRAACRRRYALEPRLGQRDLLDRDDDRPEREAWR